MSENNLAQIRKEIDATDQQIVAALAYRADLIIALAKFKTTDQIYDAQREAEIIANVIDYSRSTNLNFNFIQSLYKQILNESKKQLKIILKK